MSELREAVAAAKADPEVRVVVITGAGDKAFSAGCRSLGHGGGRGVRRPPRSAGRDGPPVPRCVGAGQADDRGSAASRSRAALVSRSMCDFVIAAEDAQFGTPEIDVGLWPMMITVPLMRSMPPKKALELMMTGRRVGAAEAERIGFVNTVVPVAELDATVDDLARDTGVEVAGHRQARPGRVLRRVGPIRRRRAASAASPSDDHDATRGRGRRASRRSPRSGSRSGRGADQSLCFATAAATPGGRQARIAFCHGLGQQGRRAFAPRCRVSAARLRRCRTR